MPPPSARQARERRRLQLKARGVTYNRADFKWVCRHTDRINIVAEGDSWFAYPREHLLFGPNSNMLDFVANSICGSGKANLLRLASNGDEAVAMLAGEQKHTLAGVLKENADHIHLILFSGGGNDVVGKWDMERLLNNYEPGFTAEDCVNRPRLKRKLQQLGLAYEELIELRDEYAPSARIVSHTYDLVQPRDASAKFVAGLIAKGPWIYPYLVARGIPPELHLPTTTLLLAALADKLLTLAARPAYRSKLYVVHTQGTLRPGHTSDWKDEIHPTPSGFRRISRPYYSQLKELQPGLPAFKASVS